MSIEVDHLPIASPLTNDWTRLKMNGITAACLPHQSCSLTATRKVEHTTRTIKTQISRSREASPACEAAKTSVLGYTRYSSHSGSASPKVLQKTRVKGVNTTVAVTSSSILKTADTLSKPCPAMTICDKLKKLTIGAQVFNGLSPAEVASRLEQSLPDSGAPLVLDCRPFIAYNMVHMTGALSLNCCDRLTKKRLQCGKIHLCDIISGEEGKRIFKQNKDSSDIIVYDEESDDLDKPGPPTSLKLVVTTLQKEGHKVFYLKGGMSSFQSEYSNLCTKPDYKPPPKLLYSPTTPAVIDDSIDTAVISQILPFLYIGNERDVANLDLLKEHGITHVLNVTSHIPLHFESQGIIYKRLPASDSGNQNLKQYFTEAFTFIEEAKKNNGKILVHCQAGVSRSATITISYIMKSMSMKMMPAFHFVKSKRSIVSPNFNFMGQLYELEQQMSGDKTPNLLTPPLPFELQMRCTGNM